MLSCDGFTVVLSNRKNILRSRYNSIPTLFKSVIYVRRKTNMSPTEIEVRTLLYLKISPSGLFDHLNCTYEPRRE